MSRAASPRHHQLVVSRFFYEEAFRHFPILKKNSWYQAFFWYLCFGAFFDTDSERLLLCRDIIADLIGTDRANFEAGKFLEQFGRDVLGETNFQWSRWREGHCQQLLKLKLGSFSEILHGEYEGRWDKTGWICLDSEKWSAAKARHARKVQRGLAHEFPTDCRQAEFIQQYLNHLPSNLFTRTLSKNYRSAYRYALDSLSGGKLQREVRLLTRIRLQPQPFYSATPNGRTVRLFALGGIPALQREVRKCITQDWLDADLRCSQLAICAWAWKIEPILTLLYSKKNVWEYLFSFFDVSEDIKPDIKRVLKTTLYSICYGMEEHALKWSIFCNCPWPLADVIASRFLDIPLIRELLKARTAAAEQVIQNGGAANCFDKFIKLGGDMQPRDILAQVAQAWEMRLIYPAFDLASRTNDFKITLFQHDGFSVHFHRRQELWQGRITEAVNSEIARLGIPTWLEWDET